MTISQERKIKDVSAKVINVLLFQTFHSKVPQINIFGGNLRFIESERTNGDPCSPCPTRAPARGPSHQPKARPWSSLAGGPETPDLLQTGQRARGDRRPGVPRE